MPEMPEVEVLTRHLGPLLAGRQVLSATINRRRVLGRTGESDFRRAVKGASFKSLIRRGKYLVFELEGHDGKGVCVVGHLGMTGRMYLLDKSEALPKHAAVVLDLGRARFVFEDTRYFGKLTLDTSALDRLGPEPLGSGWKASDLASALRRSRRPIKTVLMDQAVVAGIGNIYASEALFRARIHPGIPAHSLDPESTLKLWKAIRKVLREAVRWGSTIPLSFAKARNHDGLFYFGAQEGSFQDKQERLLVYDRHNLPCRTCGKSIARIIQSARSTYFCPSCQPRMTRRKVSTAGGNN